MYVCKITHEDEIWIYGQRFDKSSGDLLSNWIQLQKFDGIQTRPTSEFIKFDGIRPDITQEYLDVCIRWPVLPEFRDSYKNRN